MAFGFTTREEDGRRIATGQHKGSTVEVIAGYDINEDAYRIHVYVTPSGGQRTKIDVAPRYVPTMDEAISAGLGFGEVAADAL